MNDAISCTDVFKWAFIPCKNTGNVGKSGLGLHAHKCTDQ